MPIPRKLFVSCVVPLLLGCPLMSQTLIEGALLGANGKPMRTGQVHLAWPENHLVQSVEAEPDGHFRLQTKEQGFMLVEFTGVWHKRTEVLVFLKADRKTTLNVRLALHHFLEHPKRVTLVADLKNASPGSSVPMTEDKNGCYAAELQTSASSISYELVGITDDRASINGTQSERFEYDGGGDYRSIVSTLNARVRIVYDPRQAPRNQTSAAQVQFADPGSPAARLARAYDRMMERRQAFSRAYRAFRASGQPLADFNYDYSAERREIESDLAKETAPAVREMLLFSYLDMGYGSNGADIEASWGQRALAEIPGTSLLWELEPELVSVAAGAAGPALADPYVASLIANHPDQKLRSEIRSELGPERKVRVGAKLPHFEVQSMSEPGKVLRAKDLVGREYLIDFWATWCQPCVDEIPNLQEAYRLYGQDGFGILSISLDSTLKTVEQFQKERYSMPWQNAIAKDGFSGSLAKSFELTGLPSPILVNASGTIVAIGTDARGRKLFSLLQRDLHGR